MTAEPSDAEWANQSLRAAIQNIQDAATKPLHAEIERLRSDARAVEACYGKVCAENDELRDRIDALERKVRLLEFPLG